MIRRTVAHLLEITERLQRLGTIAREIDRLLSFHHLLFDVQLARHPGARTGLWLRPMRPAGETAFAKIIAAVNPHVRRERLTVTEISLKTWYEQVRLCIVLECPPFCQEYAVRLPARGRVRATLKTLLALTLIEEREWMAMIDALSREDAEWRAPLETLKDVAFALKAALEQALPSAPARKALPPPKKSAMEFAPPSMKAVQRLREIITEIEKLGKIPKLFDPEKEIEEVLKQKVTIARLEYVAMPPLEVSVHLEKAIGSTLYGKLLSILKGKAEGLVLEKLVIRRPLLSALLELVIAEKSGEAVATHRIELNPGDEVEASIGDIIAFSALEEEDWKKLYEVLDEKEREWSAVLEALKKVTATLKLLV